MDILKTAREIGFFETNINIAKVLSSKDVKNKAGAVMPLPAANLSKSIEKIAKWLITFDKSKYMFFTPEIAIIEKLALLVNTQEAIILIPCDMEIEAKERLKDNLPREMKVSLLNEPYFPELFFPGNGIIVVCGYIAGERIMVLPETYRLIEHYSGFWGKKVFIPYAKIPEAIRYNGWMEIGTEKFNIIWGEKNEYYNSYR